MPEDRLSEVVDDLPFPYAAALRLDRAGASDEVIGQALGISPAGVPAALRLAWAKLAGLEAARDGEKHR